MNYERELKEKAMDLGADRFGIADLEMLRSYPTVPGDLLEGFTRGISIGVKLTDPVIDNLPESRSLYADQYRVVNDSLNRISFRLARFIEEEGYSALEVPASKIVSEGHWQSLISHKAVARAAGMGWIGKSLLLINPEYGPRLRWVTVLTDMDLNASGPVENKCGDCTECVDACIVDAFKDSEFEDYPGNRDSCFEVDRCARKLEEFADDPQVGSMVCGICIKACPWGSAGNNPSS